MTIFSILPPIAGILLIIFLVFTAFRNEKIMKNMWILFACISVMFFIFSVVAVLSEGPLGFWTEHIRNMWGNQIWFDLLLAVGIGWFLIVPKAKAVKMRLFPWGLFIVSTGCIGFSAMIARLLYLEKHS